MLASRFAGVQKSFGVFLQNTLMDPDFALRKDPKIYERIRGCKPPFVHLNSGVWISDKEYALEFFEEALTAPPVPKFPCSDQGVFRNILRKQILAGDSRLGIDDSCRVVQSVFRVTGAEVEYLDDSGEKLL